MTYTVLCPRCGSECRRTVLRLVDGRLLDYTTCHECERVYHHTRRPWWHWALFWAVVLPVPATMIAKTLIRMHLR